MKCLKIIALFLFIISIVGCSLGRETGIWISEEGFRNYDASKEASETFLLYWPFQSGMIREGLGSDMNKLPQDIVVAMDKLDTIAKKSTAERTEEELGGALVLQAKVKGEVAKIIYNRYVPGLFQMLQFTH